ncbi:asparagine synthase (glutamine-hydrolyzing) [candidate division KSB1 bacterium]|nr:MAG: asparagine synthase (glutamine-hydrolyzing) [candidate division KSB1 bacterium]
MCGISGIFFVDEPRPGMASRIHRMTDTLRHRGPDDEGYCLVNSKTGACRFAAGAESVEEIRNALPTIDGLDQEPYDLALGHRRFAILDLTAGGHQPYFDERSNIGGVFNGLIYNYNEVKTELEAEGVSFYTDCDTEVLFKAYAFWGERCFAKFNGTWAVAIYDFNKRELLLSRDRLGKKPIYVHRTRNALYFASEIKAILRVLNTEVRVNERAVFDYLIGGYRDLSNTTFYEDIESLPPASVLRINARGETASSKYWDLHSNRDSALASAAPGEVAKELRRILEDAVRIRLRADVNLGIELSGGLDSSSIAGLASTVHPRQLSCFTVEYPQTKWNEEPYAREVAMRFKMDYHVVRSPERWFWNDVNEFVALHEEPFHSPNLHTQQAVWRLMHDTGIRVILYGAGGDEVFAGYRKEYFYRHLRDLLKRGQIASFAKNFMNFSELSAHELLAKAWQQFMPKPNNTLPAHSLFTNGLAHFPMLAANGGTAEAQLYMNMTELKMPYWLLSNDKNSLAIPVEVRAPLLDYRLVEFAFQLPVGLLIRDGWLKWILRKAMDDLLPPAITWRRKKMGYPFPLQDWLWNSMRTIETLLAESENPYLNRRYVCENLQPWIAQQPDLVWRILSLELWHRCFIRKQKVASLRPRAASRPATLRAA